MTTPVTDDDLVSGATKYLRAQPDVIAAVSSFVIGGVPTPGIFPYYPWDMIEGSSGTAVVLSSDGGGWAAANTYNTLRFPRLVVNIWADPIRDTKYNNVGTGEVMRRVFATFKTIDGHLHRTSGAEVMFGQLRIISSTRLTEPVIYMVPDGDGLVRCLVNYAITEG